MKSSSFARGHASGRRMGGAAAAIAGQLLVCFWGTPAMAADVELPVNSLQVLDPCFVEPALSDALPGSHFQFERTGYFSVDSDSTDGKLVFNRTVGLRDTWGKIEQTGKG